MFTQKFYSKTKFLYWDGDSRIKWSNEVTEDQRKRIAGEAIELILLGQFNRPTFFVEDKAHEMVVQSVADIFGKNVAITQCRTKTNVRSLYMLSLTEGDWKNSYFMVDGDNQGNPYKNDEKYIHLDKYCIETYLLNISIAAQLSGKNEEMIREYIATSIQECREDILRKGKNKFFEFLVDRLKASDITEESLSKLDASGMFKSFVQKLDMDHKTYIDAFIKTAYKNNQLDEVLPEHLVDAISPPDDEELKEQETPALKAVD